MRLDNWHNVEQNSDPWLDLRAGKVTGSSIGKVMANFGKAFGEPAKKLAVNLAVERVTGRRIENDGYSNSHMERGHEEEPIARMRYEELYFMNVGNGGFFDNGDTGCSPDGIVSPEGIIEIKSVVPTTHYANIKRGTFDPTYKWQFVFNLRESGAKWLDFISYCSSFPRSKNLYVYRIECDAVVDEAFMIDKRLAEFEAMVSGIMEDIREAA